MEANRAELIKHAGTIVSAYVANNRVQPGDVPALLATVHGALLRLVEPGAASAAAGSAVEKPTPAQIKASVKHDGIVSFIDGRSYQTLKRHLTAQGLSVEAYKARYGLPSDYPIVAPGYAERRSELAKAIGLGVAGGQGRRAAA